MVYIPVDVEAALVKECKRRRYSDRTAQTYLFCVRKFLKFAGKTLDRISKKDVRLFLEHLSDNGLAGSTLNVNHMALRFLFEEVLDKRIWIDIKYSKVPERLPAVLTKDEVKRLFEAIPNEKHRLMVQMLYAAGLRVSELVNLNVGELEIEKGYGFVRRGKGGKDRIFVIADALKSDLIELIRKEELNDDDSLFKSIRGRKYNIASVRAIMKEAAKKAKIGKNVHPHTLRHSFATHVIEDGYSVSDVQALLGHKSPETTFVYLHGAAGSMINVRSPMDGF